MPINFHTVPASRPYHRVYFEDRKDYLTFPVIRNHETATGIIADFARRYGMTIETVTQIYVDIRSEQESVRAAAEEAMKLDAPSPIQTDHELVTCK